VLICLLQVARVGDCNRRQAARKGRSRNCVASGGTAGPAPWPTGLPIAPKPESMGAMQPRSTIRMLGDNLGRFGDERLERVGTALVASMQHNRTVCLHRLAKDRQEARSFGDFLANYRVSVQEMRVTVGRQTGRRVAGRHVLAIPDTSELHFTTHTGSKKGFGTGGNGVDLGLFLHPIPAVDADNGGIIGLVDCAIINRTEGKVTDRHKRPAEDKESHRWLEGAFTSGDVLAEAATITMVADRESDIYDLFAPPAGQRPVAVPLVVGPFAERRRPALQPLRRMG
jgi:hypothetical protein